MGADPAHSLMGETDEYMVNWDKHGVPSSVLGESPGAMGPQRVANPALGGGPGKTGKVHLFSLLSKSSINWSVAFSMVSVIFIYFLIEQQFTE